MSTYRQSLHLHIAPAHKAAGDYTYVNFTLPRAAHRLHVRYRYSHAISSDQQLGGNVIDLGLFDPRGAHFPGSAGFRGWSGSARQEFEITPTAATPGYLPGPLPAGEYQLILGLYRIWEQGAEVEIEVSAELAEEPDTGPAPVHGLPAGQPPPPLHRPFTRWLRGDLQSHTVHSDAQGSLAQLVARARGLGLDYLAITDHNTVSHHPFLPALADAQLLLIPGQEVTTYYGHMNVWGTGRWCDFRCRSDAQMAAVIDWAHAHGGVCSINHPKVGGPAWEYDLALPVDAMEVWQGPWPHRNQQSLDLWDRLLTAGRRLPAVGGSDYHCPQDTETSFLRLGEPTTWVQVREASVAGILEAITAGRCSISAGPAGPRLALSAHTQTARAAMGEVLSLGDESEALQVVVQVEGGAGYTLQLWADGDPQQRRPIVDRSVTISCVMAVQRYVRAELIGDLVPERLPPDAPADLDLREWRWALSNPIYVRTEGMG